MDKNGNEIITRTQRIHNAVHAGLPIDFVQNTLKVDVKKTIKDFSTLNRKLSKLSHIEETTFGLGEAEAEQFANEALETFSLLYETIEDCRISIRSTVETYAKHAVLDDLTNDVQSELDQLATHYTIEQVNLEDLTIDTMDSTRLKISLTGSVECEFQYGSSSDVERGDGLITHGGYPFTCDYEADINRPTDLSLVYGTLKIDNSSFYED